jgi:hypothetical protein
MEQSSRTPSLTIYEYGKTSPHLESRPLLLAPKDAEKTVCHSGSVLARRIAIAIPTSMS